MQAVTPETVKRGVVNFANFVTLDRIHRSLDGSKSRAINARRG